jgi:hypothetical protein
MFQCFSLDTVKLVLRVGMYVFFFYTQTRNTFAVLSLLSNSLYFDFLRLSYTVHTVSSGNDSQRLQPIDFWRLPLLRVPACVPFYRGMLIRFFTPFSRMSNRRVGKIIIITIMSCVALSRRRRGETVKRNASERVGVFISFPSASVAHRVPSPTDPRAFPPPTYPRSR